jgi:hypothetical protein
MTPDAISRMLLMCWMGALGLLLIRLLWLRLHHDYLLFAVSCATDVIFGITMLHYGLASQATAGLGLLGDTMDVFLTPSVGAELFGPARATEPYASRQLTPLIFTLLAGLGIDLFLVSSPDADSLQAASVLAFMVDTVVALVVVSYVLRRLRTRERTADRNLAWLQRLFAVELIASVVRSLFGLFLDSPQASVLDILFFSVCLCATSACVISLRKQPELPVSS